MRLELVAEEHHGKLLLTDLRRSEGLLDVGTCRLLEEWLRRAAEGAIAGDPPVGQVAVCEDLLPIHLRQLHDARIGVLPRLQRGRGAGEALQQGGGVSMVRHLPKLRRLHGLGGLQPDLHQSRFPLRQHPGGHQPCHLLRLQLLQLHVQLRYELLLDLVDGGHGPPEFGGWDGRSAPGICTKKGLRWQVID